MAGFTPLRNTSTEELVELPISTLTLAIGDMLELDVGATTWTEAAATTEHWQLKAVCAASATTADTVVLAQLVASGQAWEAESANASDAADDGDRMLLTDKNTVNNTGTDSTAEEVCFIQLGTIGDTADNRIFGMIVPGTGVNPDAA